MKSKNKVIKIIVSKIPVILLASLLCVSICFAAFTFLVKPYNKTTITVYISENDETGTTTNLYGITDNGDDELIPAKTIEALIKSNTNLETIITSNELNISISDFSKMISVTSENDNIYDIEVKSKDLEFANLALSGIEANLPNVLQQVFSTKKINIIDRSITENIYENRVIYSIICAICTQIVLTITFALVGLKDNSVHNDEDIREITKIPVLGVIPDLFDGGAKRTETKIDKNSYFIDRYSYNLDGIDINQKKHNDRNDRNVIGENLGYDAIEAYKHLRTNIEFSLSKPKNDGCKVIGITSPVRGEGKSIVASNLAYSMVENNKKVLLIDADLRSPSLSDKLRVHNKAGLVDCLKGEINPVDAIYNYDDNNPNFQLILGDSNVKNSSELLSSGNMKSLIEGLRDGYDFIIIDLPSVNIVADALTISEVVDSYVLVVRSNYSIKDEIKDCIKSIVYFETNILGFVLTDVNDGRIYYNPKPGRRNTNVTSKRSALYYTSEPPKKTQGSIVIEKEYSDAYKKADEILKKFESKEEDIINEEENAEEIDENLDDYSIDDQILSVFEDSIKDDE